MEGQVELTPLFPSAGPLAAAVMLDLAAGDPVYRWHPVRLMGDTLRLLERALRALGWSAYGGGVLLFLLLGGGWTAFWAGAVCGAHAFNQWAGIAVHTLLVYSLLALRDLLAHAWRVQRAANANDLESTRHAIAQLVGRDTTKMDLAACRRAAIESISENLTDGFISPLLWYLAAGIPGLVLFKVVSTMDSMVGYKTPRYLRFGWCGARTDDLMNLLPARITWLVLALVAWWLPGCSLRKALRIGWQQHALVPGPNSGWSEATMAGAIQRRLVGPVWAKGVLVTELWLGDPSDPAAGKPADLRRAVLLTLLSGVGVALAGIYALSKLQGQFFE